VNFHEDTEQAMVFEWASYHPKLRWMHSVPNGGNRNPREAARLKKQGVKSGVSDIFLPMAWRSAGGQYNGLYIEMKRRKSDGPSKPTEKQREFQAAMVLEGYKCAICYGADEAIELIKNYMKQSGS
jgi:hypothetical protein